MTVTQSTATDPETVDGLELHGNTQLNLAGEERLYQQLKRFWQPVAFSADLTDSPHQVTLFDTRLAVARLDGVAHTFSDICRHRGSALSLGRIDGCQLRCAYHGWAYDAEGTVVDIPARPELNGKLVAQLPTYPTIEAGGLVWTCISGETPLFGPSECPELEDPSYRVLRFDPYEWDCSVARRLENYFDFSHFAHVHHGILGDRDEAEIEDYDVYAARVRRSSSTPARSSSTPATSRTRQFITRVRPTRRGSATGCSCPTPCISTVRPDRPRTSCCMWRWHR